MNRPLLLAVLLCPQIAWTAGVKTSPVRVTVAPISGAAGASYGAASLSLPQTQFAAPASLPSVAPVFSQAQLGAATQVQAAAVLPAAAPTQAAATARTPDAGQTSALRGADSSINPAAGGNKRGEAVTSKAALTTLGGEIAGAKKSGASAAAPIAKAFDGGVKTAGSAASAVAAYGDFTPTRMAGLRHTGGIGEGENANFDAGKKPSVAAATPKSAQPEFEEFDFRRALAGFLVWLMLVGLVVLEYGAIYYAITHAPAAQPTQDEIYWQQYGPQNGDWPF